MNTPATHRPSPIIEPFSIVPPWSPAVPSERDIDAGRDRCRTFVTARRVAVSAPVATLGTSGVERRRASVRTNAAASSGPPPSSSRRTSALPDDHAVGAGRGLGGLLGRRDPDAEQHRLVGDGLAAPAHLARRGSASCVALAGDTHAATRRRRSRANARRSRASRSSGVVGAASSTVSTPAASAASPQPSSSSSGRSGTIAPSTPALAQVLRAALVARCARRGCSTSSRRAAPATSIVAIASITPIGVAPRSSARWLASWIVRPSMIGSENGMPTSTASAPASTTARTTSCHSRPSPPVTYGTSSLRAGVAAARADATRGSLERSPEHLRDLRRVLVAAARQRDEHRRARRDRVPGLARDPRRSRARARARARCPRSPTSSWKPGERLVVGGGVVLGPARRREHRVLGPDARDSRGRR